MSTNDSTNGAGAQRPGLSELPVRVGTQSTFLARMLERAPREEALAHLDVFAADEPVIALLDACAATLDTVAFYQERIVNESYLRTATEHRSHVELARTVGYEPSAGVAATTLLCFTVDDASSAPRRVPVPVGTRAQSVPGPDEEARTFETTEPLEARPEWNAMRPLTAQPQDLDVDDAGRLELVALDGGARVTAGALRVAGVLSQVKRGDVIAVARGGRAQAATVLGVQVDVAEGVTTLELDPIAPTTVPSLPPPRSLGLPQTGVAPRAGASLDTDVVRETIVRAVWDEDALAALIAARGWDADVLVESVGKVLAADALDTATVHAFRQRAGFFGNAAQPYTFVALAEVPQRAIVESALATTQGADRNLATAGAPARVAQSVVDAVAKTASDPTKSWDAGGGRTVWQTDAGGTYEAALGVSVHLDRVVAEASPGTLVVFEDRRTASSTEVVRRVYRVSANRERALVGFRQQARTSGLVLGRADGSPLSAADRDPAFRFRSATAHVASERLPLAMLPVTELLEERVLDLPPRGAKTIVLDRMVLGLTRGRTVIVRGREPGAGDGIPGAMRVEAARLVAIRHERGRTTLYLDRNLAHRYVRTTVTICANVALASHGETIAGEVLGGGRGALAQQSFRLRRDDLTYVRGDQGRGASPALTVHVQDRAWTRVGSLHGAAPDARVYTLRHAPDGHPVIAFGDGRHGARLPTGEANVTATYRAGLGLGGNVRAGTITTALTRPLGLREVVNPLPAMGGADPADARAIRESAPRSTTTLSRAVSLRDFEAFALDFEGVARARAEAVWTGSASIPFVTVAGPDGAPIPDGGEVSSALTRALARSGDGRRTVRVGSYVPRAFALDLVVWVAGADHARVAADVTRAITVGFGFAARALGAPATQAELLALAQGVPGVVGASITRLRILHGPDDVGAPPALLAFGARWDRATRRIVPAELLLIDPSGVSITTKASTP